MPVLVKAKNHLHGIVRSIPKTSQHTLRIFKITLWNGASEWHLKESKKQETKQWTKFEEFVSQNSHGLKFSDYYHEKFFDDYLDKSNNRKMWEIFYRSCTWACLLIFVYFAEQYFQGNIGFQNWIISPLATAIFFMTFTLISYKKRFELKPETLVEAINVSSKTKALKFLNTLLRKTLPKYRFAIRDKMGNYLELPQDFYKAENVLLFLFGREYHRRALTLTGEYPTGDLYISVAAETKDTRPGEELLNFLRNEKELRSFCSYVRSFEGLDPTTKKKLIVSRNSWLNAFEVILEDFELWLKVCDKDTTTQEMRNFEKKIKSLLEKNSMIQNIDTAYLNFIEGKNRNVNSWRKDVLKTK